MNTLQNCTTHSFYTKFYPALQSFTGSAISTLVIDKLEYWFSNPKYVGGFYKFIEPCGHPLYREGDSWSEELGVSRKLFAKAFDIIGVRYNSKSAYLKAEDKFQGKLYASYHDRKTNRTYFVRNHEFTSQLLERLKTSYVAVKQKLKKRVEATLDKKSLNKNATERTSIENTSIKTSSLTSLENVPLTTAPSALSQGRSRNGELGRSYARASSFIHKKTSSLEAEVSHSELLPDSHFKEETEEMIKIWKEEVGELGVPSLSNGLITRLQGVLRELFDNSLESWKGYCQMISSSKFLMGEAQNKFFKKAWITWAINPENIERIKGGDFKLGDRQTNHDKAIESIDLEIRSGEYKKHQVEMQIANIKSEIRDKRRTFVKERIKNLSREERQSLEQAFEDHLKQENNSMTEEFRKSRWNGMFISAYFDTFVEEKIYAELFKKADEDNDEKVVQSSGLLELLNDVCHDLDQVKQKKRRLELRAVTPDSLDFKSSNQNPFIDSSFDREVFNELEKTQNILGVWPQRS